MGVELDKNNVFNANLWYTDAVNYILDPCAGANCTTYGFTPTANMGSCKCSCNGETCAGGNRCDDGICKCGDSTTLCGYDPSKPHCKDKTTNLIDENAFTKSAKTSNMQCAVSHDTNMIIDLYELIIHPILKLLLHGLFILV